jgi:hypothetical protein
MKHKRLILAVYGLVVICVWWIIQEGESISGWFTALLIIAAGVGADYIITSRKRRLR